MKKTIRSDFSHELVIKKSRFICHLKRVGTEEEARAFIEAIKKQHYKANHNCSAFTLGDRQEIQRSSDDGEPSGTAGVPMLEVLKQRGLINVVAIVTRYFGGIKLGAGGLIRAYASSVSEAIQAVGEVKIVQQTALVGEIPYHLYDKFNRFLVDKGYQVQAEFGEAIQVHFFVDVTQITPIIAEIIDSFDGKIQLVEGSTQEVEVPV